MMELARFSWMVTSRKDGSQLAISSIYISGMLAVEEAHSKISSQDKYSFTPVYTREQKSALWLFA